MIIISLVSVSLNAEEIKSKIPAGVYYNDQFTIVDGGDVDIKKVIYNELVYFLVTPLFMNEVEIVDRTNTSNEKIIKYYEDKEALFDQSFKLLYRKDVIIKILTITTSLGLTISLGFAAGIIVFALLNYYRI